MAICCSLSVGIFSLSPTSLEFGGDLPLTNWSLLDLDNFPDFLLFLILKTRREEGFFSFTCTNSPFVPVSITLRYPFS